jgi:hypothetical protein
VPYESVVVADDTGGVARSELVPVGVDVAEASRSGPKFESIVERTFGTLGAPTVANESEVDAIVALREGIEIAQPYVVVAVFPTRQTPGVVVTTGTVVVAYPVTTSGAAFDCAYAPVAGERSASKDALENEVIVVDAIASFHVPESVHSLSGAGVGSVFPYRADTWVSERPVA